MGLIIMTWPFLKYWGLVISILMWVDMFLGEMFLGRAPNTLFWGKKIWQTLGVALSLRILIPRLELFAILPSEFVHFF